MRKIYVFAIVFMCLLLNSLVQAKPSQPVQDLLKELNEASCMRDEEAQGQSSALNPNAERTAKPDLHCAITIAELQPLLAQSSTVLIDTRFVEEFNAGHIDGALHMPAFAVKTQNFLKNNLVVLFGNGKGDRELLTTCAELKASGFSRVRVLRGGAISWAAAKMPWLGYELNLNQLGLLSAQDLAIEVAYPDNVILSSGKAQPMKFSIPTAVSIANSQVSTLKQALERRSKELKSDRFSSLIVLAEPGFDKTRIADIARALKPVPVLVYADNLESYEQFTATQQAMLKVKNKGVKKSKCQYR